MRQVHTLLNDAHDQLELWVEPWADLYVVPRGAKVAFSYTVEGEAHLLESELAGERFTFWFSGPDAPEVRIDGAIVEPIDQHVWQSKTREPRS